jgi:hypothetical protein
MKFPLSVVSAVAFVAGCKPQASAPPKAVPAVEVSKKVAEGDLAVVTLTPQAEQRLGIATVASTKKKTSATRTYAGELLLSLARGGENSIAAVLPAMTPADLARNAQAQADADGQIAAAQVQLDAARIALKRAEELIASKSGVGRTVDETRTQVGLAEAALKTAREKRALLGVPVFEAVKSGNLWVRVPVYVGDLPQLKRDAPAAVSVMGAEKAVRLSATPVAVPFSAAANPAIAELFFALTGADAAGLRPGIKVSVELPLNGEDQSLVVPAAAILHDVHGNAWVYEKIGEHAFTRRRVELRRITEGDAVLQRGPAVGAKIVTDGAAELFGTEFGAGK